MKKESDQIEALQDIRKMMKDSSRFLSLSGLSGIFAGLFALMGAYLTNRLITEYFTQEEAFKNSDAYAKLISNVIFITVTVLVLSIASAFYFSYLKAKKNNHKLFDHTSKQLLWSLIVPLAAGGIFCLALLSQGSFSFIAPAMLIFYGLSLVSSSRLTLNDLKYLGYMELVLGLLGCFIPEYGLFLWSIGFGILHIVYGSIVWYKYDLKP